MTILYTNYNIAVYILYDRRRGCINNAQVLGWSGGAYLPQTGDRLGALSRRYPTGAGRSVRKPWPGRGRRITIETYCVLPKQRGGWEPHTPRRHTTVALRRVGPPPPGWRWFMSGAGSPGRPIVYRTPVSHGGRPRFAAAVCAHQGHLWRRRVLFCQRSTFCSAHWILLGSAIVIELCPCGPTIMIMSNLFLLSSATCSVSQDAHSTLPCTVSWAILTYLRYRYSFRQAT